MLAVILTTDTATTNTERHVTLRNVTADDALRWAATGLITSGELADKPGVYAVNLPFANVIKYEFQPDPA